MMGCIKLPGPLPGRTTEGGRPYVDKERLKQQ